MSLKLKIVKDGSNMPERKPLPFSDETFQEIAHDYGTPIYVYDEEGIKRNAQAINDAFAWSPDYVNHYATKAAPTPGVLRVVAGAGMGFDCSSRPELRMIQMMLEEGQIENHGLFYTSNNTPDSDYQLAAEMGAVINIDKLPYLEQVKRALGGVLPQRMAVRYNPGNKVEGNPIIGKPMESKFGEIEDNVLIALQQMVEGGVESVGIHTMAVSNERRPESFALTARLLKELADKATTLHGIEVDFINIGGGIGVNYRPDEKPVDVAAVGQAVESELGDLGIPIVSENGRYVTGPHGYLLTGITHGITETHAPYLQVDTSINNMARLATVTAAYHQLDVLGKQDDPQRELTVVGSMCANSDRMFKEHSLPATVEPGDLMVVHDAGAHCRANSHNYNFRTRCGEVMVYADGTHDLIRRHETEEDLFATTNGL